MKHLYAVIVLMIGLCGCEKGDSTPSGTSSTAVTNTSSDVSNNGPAYSITPDSTGVTPTAGSYSFSAYGIFVVKSSGELSFSLDGYAHYSIPIHGGAIAYCNGVVINNDGNYITAEDSSGNAYPTDGFAINGQWTSPTHCQGTIWYAVDGFVTKKVNFSADL